MTPIQVVLTVAIVALASIAIARLRSRIFATIVVTTIGLGGIILVLRPEWSSRLAQLLGVGRGADLVLYLGLIGLAFISLVLYSKLRIVEQRLTDIVRAVSIDQAKGPGSVKRSGRV